MEHASNAPAFSLSCLICSTEGTRIIWIPVDCSEQIKVGGWLVVAGMAQHDQEKTHNLRLLPQKEKRVEHVSSILDFQSAA